uniref:Uncharacterized protein n=1 Tax=Parascaris equorum TaxID=6256 RepID=A0A914RM41_PAREQ
MTITYVIVQRILMTQSMRINPMGTENQSSQKKANRATKGQQQIEADLTEDDIVGPRLYPDPDAMEEEEDRPEPTIVEVNTARICPNFKDEGLYFFDEDEQMDEEGRARLKLRVENTIRWRYAFDEGGNIVNDSGCHCSWAVRHLMCKCSQCNMIITYSCDRALVYRDMPFSSRLSFVELVRREEERLRAQNRREAQLRRNKMRPSVRTGLSANFLEEREDDSGWPIKSCVAVTVSRYLNAWITDESLSTIKKHYKNRYDDRPLIGHSDSEDSDSKRLHDVKKDSDESDSDQVKQ